MSSGSVTMAECEAVAERALAMENARDVKSYLKEEVKKHVRCDDAKRAALEIRRLWI